MSNPKYKQMDNKSFERALGTRELDKKVIVIIIPDPVIGKSVPIQIPFDGKISKLTILTGENNSTGTTEFNITRSRRNDPTFDSITVNDTIIELTGEKYKEIASDELTTDNDKLQVQANDFFEIDIVNEAMIRPSNITFQIHVDV